ncbi:MAG: DUF1993 domain-containing protein [Erythrobacter sp.]|uniref:DUF1993 domain-containing protein n=1 Tax=Erythrobacter sp. TaxID=1042 RepID=UPI002613417C|nr:DUF1993 domain-containing protein [Erythrobacter sp.]MDJ0978661.1 DUF1993 domain-containing protein [Erythrobacter sp.]
MPLSLHAAFVPSCQQILGGVRAMIDQAEGFAREHEIADAEFIEAKLADDMWSLPWHVRACWVHSKLALDLMPTGEFSPDFTDVPASWDAMRAMADDALDGLGGVDESALEAIAENRVFFVLGGKRLMEFTVANFLLSFSQPNFYFHATTFYDILRMKGLPLNKRAFLHTPRAIEN